MQKGPSRSEVTMAPKFPLQIQLLGDLRLTCGNKPITSISSPRLQALLAFLLLHREAAQSRQHLAFLFWPDSSEINARNNFRQLLFDLRHALPDFDSFCDSDAATIQWCADSPFTLDVDELEKTFAEAERAVRGQDETRAQTALEQAVTLYRGDLLPSCYDDWITAPREHLRQTFIAALEKLVHLLEDRRDYAAAIRHAQRLLQQDPLHEATYQQLMRLHARSGDRAGVARIYQTCVTVLDRELGVSPSDETQQVYKALLSSKPALVTEPASAIPLQVTNNLPIPLTRFVGREQEQAEIKRLITEKRLLTLTGAGGIGKTRLALAASDDLVGAFADGVWWVDLASLRDSAQVPQAIISTLHIQESRDRSLLDAIVDYLHDKTMVLLLDNCEHLIDACTPLIESLLSSAPSIHILATSREVLGIAGEMAWRVPSLSVPSMQDIGPLGSGPISSLLQYDSIRLFADRAAMTLPTFSLTDKNAGAIQQICQALDGIPLAIELAAARLKALSPDQIAARLDDRFHLLTGGSRTALPRHKTLSAAIDWSYDLLPEAEQIFFQQLSVFVGGFSLDAMEAICAMQDGAVSATPLDLLSRLIDKSLVAVEERDGEVRYRMLETLRQYALDRLVQSGQAASLRSSHCSFFLLLSEEAEGHLRSTDQLTWLDRLDTEYENISAAIEWSLSNSDAETCLRFGGALWYFWTARARWTDGRERLDRILSLPVGPFGCARAMALLGAGYLAFHQGDFGTATRCFENSLEISRTAERSEEMAEAHYGLGVVEQYKGDCEKARGFFTEGLALSRDSNNPWGIGDGFLNLALLRLNEDDYDGARALFEPGLAAFRKVDDKRSIAKLLAGLGLVAYYQADYAAARPLFEEALAIEVHLRDKHVAALQLDNLGYVALHQNEYPKARTLFGQSIALLDEIGGKRSIADVLYGLAGLAAAEGEPERAAHLFGAAEALLEQLGARVEPMNRAEYDRIIASAQGQMDPAPFEAAQSRGRAMSLQEAVRYALAGVDR